MTTTLIPTCQHDEPFGCPDCVDAAMALPVCPRCGTRSGLGACAAERFWPDFR